MNRTFTCERCQAFLFKGDVKSLLAKRRPDAPDYIEMTCPECNHINRLTHSPSEELRKSRRDQQPD